MATQIVNFTQNISSDAQFRLWGSGIAAAIQAVGLTKTADTGQIDWVTVLRPGTNAMAGYEMYRFSDALQATAPVFIKIQYGSGLNGTTMPALDVQVGIATDGAGNFVGPTSNLTDCETTTAITAGQTSYTYISGANNRLAIFSGLGAATSAAATGIAISIERTKDATGADTAEGILIITTRSGASQWSQQVLFPAGAGSYETTLGIVMPTVGTGANGVQIAIYPVFFTKGVYLNPPLGFIGYHHANLSALTPTSVTVYGAAHTYLPLGAAVFQLACRTGPTGTTGAAPLIRWE